MEYAGPVRALTHELHTLAFLRLSPPGSDTELSPFGSFVGLQELVITVAIVEDLSTGL
jgi:hypothetical protein